MLIYKDESLLKQNNVDLYLGLKGCFKVISEILKLSFHHIPCIQGFHGYML